MPRRFRAPNIEKYDGERDPKIWLVKYQLTMKVASAPNVFFMIQYLPIYLTDFARNWLNNLREGTIRRWADLEKAFCNHFEEAYTKLGTSWPMSTPIAKTASMPVMANTKCDSPAMRISPHQLRRIVSIEVSSWPMPKNKKATNLSKNVVAA
jgi:hypothetical protein